MKKYSKIFISVSAIACFITFYACKVEKEPVDIVSNQLVLNNLADNFALPAFEELENNARLLNNTLKGLKSDPTKITQAKENWKNLALAWNKAKVFEAGPIGNNLYHLILDEKAKTQKIESILKANEAINSDFIIKTPNYAKSLEALEYLIFSSHDTNLLEKKAKYMIAVSEEILNIATKVNTEWKTEYATIFKNEKSREINSSLSKLTNKMLEMMHTIRDERIGLPLGSRNNSVPQPDSAIRYSNFGNQLLVSEINALESVFTGNTSTNNNGKGLDDLMNLSTAGGNIDNGKNVLASDSLKYYFASLKSKVTKLSKPINESVITDNKEMEDIYKISKRTLVFLYTDMMSQLDIRVIFSDSDGD